MSTRAAASTLRLAFARATEADAPAIAALRTATARDLTARHGRGHWSGETSERGVLSELRRGQVWVARRGRAVVGVFQLGTRKPWAIDVSYFTPCRRPLYLTNMAVRPDWQRRGVGRRCLEEVIRIAREWPADAVRLDAYDAAAGAGDFYARCGFRPAGGITYHGVPLLYYELVHGLSDGSALD
ncbi:MAG TPA: GNAT family N-acetyltransferase [Longimicrobiaceae bacterium]|nr:GNAT family N-acetyltransferase [Longimicrobiaceae bacterium]